MPEMINIKEIESELGYRDKRSVKKFLDKLKIQIIKIGKNYSVVKEDWDGIIADLIDRNKNNNSVKSNKYRPIGKSEKQFSQDLQNFYIEL